MNIPGRKPNINLGIAKSHQFAGQLVGTQLSIANLLALLVSTASVIAGATTLAVQQFPNASAWLIWVAAGGIGTGLALLIEGLTLSALIRIRVASRAIYSIEEKLQIVREKRLEGLSLPNPAAPAYPLLKKRYHEARKLIERDFLRSRKQQTRLARRNRGSSTLLALGGCISSMCAGGLFYHSILAGLGPLTSLALSGVFTLAVTGTFVSSEIFKDLQSQAIRENFANGDLAESAMRQETRMQSLWAVHAHIATYLQSAEAQQGIAEGGKLLVTHILEEIQQDLRRQSAKPGLPAQISYLESPRSPGQPWSEASESQTEQKQAGIVSRETPGYGQSRRMPDSERAIRATGYEQQEEVITGTVQGIDSLARPSILAQTPEAIVGVSTPGYEEPEAEQPEKGSTAHSLGDVHLDAVERSMLRALSQASPEQRAELLRLAQTQPQEELTQAIHQLYPSYATYLTQQRVARVMAVALRSLDIQPAPILVPDGSLSTTHSLAIPVTGYALTVARHEGDDFEQNRATGYDNGEATGQATSYGQSDTQSFSLDWSTPKQQNSVHSPEPGDSPELVMNNVRPFPVARVAQSISHHSPERDHRLRIKAVMEQAQKEKRSLSYQDIAQDAKVGYSTVKKYAPGIREELQAANSQE